MQERVATCGMLGMPGKAKLMVWGCDEAGSGWIEVADRKLRNWPSRF